MHPNKTKKLRSNQKKIQDKEHLPGQRVPRPLGLTLSLISIHNQQGINGQITDLQTIKKRVVEQWSSNGMRLNNRTYTVVQLSQYVNLPVDIVQKYMWGAMKKMGKVFDTKDAGENARALFSHCLNLGFEILSESRSQLEVLKASQAGRYQPFISSTVNQALANLITAQNPLQSLLKVITDKQPINLIYQHTTNPNQDTNHITTERAMKMLEEAGPSMLNDPHLADAQVALYKSANLLPDINARTQDLRGIGIKHNGTPPVIGSKGEEAGQPNKSRRKLRLDDEILSEDEAKEFSA